MLSELRTVIQKVNRETDPAVVLHTIVTSVCEVMHTEACSIFLVDPRTGRHVFMATEGLNRDQVGKISLAPGEGLVGLVANRAEPLNLKDAHLHPSYRPYKEAGETQFSAFLGVPIIHHRTVLGVLMVQQKASRRFDEKEEALLVTLSAQLASIIDHARASGDMDRARDWLRRRQRKKTNARFIGVPGAPGVGIGKCIFLDPPVRLSNIADRKAANIKEEVSFFQRAVTAVRDDIQQLGDKLKDSLSPQERTLFDAYLHMLDDDALSGEIIRRIREGQWAQGALRQVITEHVSRFEQMEDSYLRERASDVKELGYRVLSHLQQVSSPKKYFPRLTILAGEEITTAMLQKIPPERLAGVVSMTGSSSSHIAILARAMGVPTVMGAEDVPYAQLDGGLVIVDGFYGEVYANPTRALLNRYRKTLSSERQFHTELMSLKDEPGVTRDGHRVSMWVNVGLSADLQRSRGWGAEGVGLYRTEIPFMNADRFPTEEEQRVLYREALLSFDGRPVTMRTLDVGGDKALPYFPIQEDNPFLGWRGIRVTLDHPEILLAQVRAMIKASAGQDGELRIMLPMVTHVSEIKEALTLVRRSHQEVAEEGYDVQPPKVGVMIEVPAAAYQAREIARHVDFMSIGSNDLTQYLLAVDRNNPRVADIYQELHPVVLSTIKSIVDAGNNAGVPVGICGELAGEPMGAILLVAMGMQTLSMSAPNLPRVKWALRAFDLRETKEMLFKVLAMPGMNEVVDMMHKELADHGLKRLLRPKSHG